MKKTASFAIHLLTAFILGNVATSQLGATTMFSTYLFEGTCADCQVVGAEGTGVLTLADYTRGQALNVGNFVSFDYASNNASFSITSSTIDSIGGTIPVSLPAAASVTIFGINSVFISQLNGQWCISTQTNSCSVTGTAPDYGFSGSFAPAPEPGTLGLALSGLAALGWSRRRRAILAPGLTGTTRS